METRAEYGTDAPTVGERRTCSENGETVYVVWVGDTEFGVAFFSGNEEDVPIDELDQWPLTTAPTCDKMDAQERSRED